MQGRRLTPEWLFLLFAVIGGLVLILLIPPLAGGNEQMNFQRSASIANGQPLVKPVALPGGIGDLAEAADARFREGAKPPFSYSRAEWERLAEIELQADRPRISRPNPIAVLNPVSYLPQSAGLGIGQLLGLSPLAIFYLGRLSGLLVGVALTFFAIRIIPVHKHSLAAVALLPPILFSRSTLDADQFTNGLAFLFLAMLVREIAGRGRIPARTVAALAVAAFLLAQAKSAYLLLPLLSLAIPTERFGTPARKALVCALIVLPGIAASAGWMLLLKQSYFTTLAYRTWSGIVEPERQLAFILSNPLDYAATLLETLFGTILIPKAIIEVLGVFGPPVVMPIAIIVAVAGLLAATVLSEERAVQPQLAAWRTKAAALAIAAATLGIILTLLYLQWTRFGGPVVDGFNGRYLYPLAPLLLLLIPASGRPLFRLPAPAWLLLLALVGVGGTWWVTWRTYLA